MSDKEPSPTESPHHGFLREVGRSVVDEAKSSLKWTLGGAVTGAVILGGVGAYYFGWSGLGIGLVAGAVIGILVVWWFAAQI